MVRKRTTAVLCTAMSTVAYILGTYGDTIVTVLKSIVAVVSGN